ncbi:MAG TPA: GNAT family N-acetyltransferase [Chloroflexia bacterium]|nr:GNAT family N-acetyltransferase [Chloroflexia bacterium]
MTGITVGRPWGEGGFKDLRIEPYQETAADQEALTAVVNATRGTGWSVDQVARFYGHPAFELERDARLVWTGETPVAAAICYPTIHLHDRAPGNFEIFVVPPARGRGLGSRLLAHLEAAARGRGHHVLETTVDQQDAPGRQFLLTHGFSIVGQAAHLERADLADLPAVGLPPGFAISSLEDDPHAGEHYRALCNRLGAYDAGYNLIEPEELDALIAEATWDPAGIFVLEDPVGREVGVIRASGAAGGAGTLHEIRLDPTYRGRSLGTALVGEALGFLAAQSVRAVALDTAGPDAPAYRLAARCGFVERHRWQQFLKPLASAA